MNGPRLRLATATLLGAALVAVLAGVVYLTAGLLVVAGIVGWGTAIAVRVPGTARRDRILAVAGAVIAVTAGLLAAWAAGVASGGTLGPLEFALDVFGPLLPLVYGIAAVVAWVASGREAAAS